MSIENQNIEILVRNIAKWIEINTSTEEFKAYKRQQIGYTLTDEWERRLGIAPQPPGDFSFPPEIEKQHALIMAFFYLRQSQMMLSQCEYYFRRFLFRGMPVSRDDHARNMCELYFGCFYIIRSRFKYTLNKLKIACPMSKIDVGKSLLTFDKAFDQELRTRNSIHHREPFDDMGLDRIMLPRILSTGSEQRNLEGWEWRHLSAYRKFAREWSRRARDRGRAMETVIETVASAILREATFLQFP